MLEADELEALLLAASEEGRVAPCSGCGLADETNELARDKLGAVLLAANDGSKAPCSCGPVGSWDEEKDSDPVEAGKVGGCGRGGVADVAGNVDCCDKLREEDGLSCDAFPAVLLEILETSDEDNDNAVLCGCCA